ncbi:MAG TPA: hypothetical protein DER09_07425 [Prolixibacteraceae bacterium]|nr:hypothetical protein [Prolixibacteraceae bacterium]
MQECGNATMQECVNDEKAKKNIYYANPGTRENFTPTLRYSAFGYWKNKKDHIYSANLGNR